MFYRALVGAIVLFWLWMMGSLARLTWFPQFSAPISVPTAYVWKLMFLHEEPSDLILYNGRQRLGNIHLQPRRQASEQDAEVTLAQQLTLVGGFAFDFPWAGKQNVVVHGSMDLGKTQEVRRLRLSAVFHDPKPSTPGTTLLIEGSPVADQWHYVVQKGEVLQDERSGTLAQLLDHPELRVLNIDPTALARMQREQMSNVTVTARHGKLRVNREEVDTYVVVVKDGNGLESTMHLNQLGQILAIKTFTGLSLLDGAISP